MRKLTTGNSIVKQRIFTNDGLRNRDYKNIERLEQNYLYAGVDSKFEPISTYIKPEENYNELKYALILFVDLVYKIILKGEFKEKYKKMILIQFGLLRGCVNDNLPEIKEEILKIINEEEKSITDDIKKEPQKFHEYLFKIRILTDPYEFIKFVKALYGSEYKQHLKEIKFKSCDEIVKYFQESLNLEEGI